MLKIFIIITLLLTFISLASGFFFLIKDDSKSTRLLTSLKYRISLAVLLILLVTYGFWSGQLVTQSPWAAIH
ncbi:MAG: twin transmembrane helix small protein [Gammaproteobacteria bacterium]|nr:twin transmembrane helix small protein [Gammaproteobacteria bacterium]